MLIQELGKSFAGSSSYILRNIFPKCLNISENNIKDHSDNDL